MPCQRLRRCHPHQPLHGGGAGRIAYEMGMVEGLKRGFTVANPDLGTAPDISTTTEATNQNSCMRTGAPELRHQRLSSPGDLFRDAVSPGSV
ncbi:hypothetical protein [Croceibacterium ferulae]|uniref:hypothetical protein n=1 Tax=Croceibacterium ferulae TaxID=1854641 RepID=UPI0015882273